MSRWQLEPEEVRAVLDDVEDCREDLAGAITEGGVQTVLEHLAWGGGVTAVVAASVARLLGDQEQRLAEIGTRVTAAVVGVSLATDAYELGDEDMALELQSQMLASADDGDLSFFAPYLEPS